MKISVWDTYVKRHDNTIMHFDILVETTINQPEVVLKYGKAYLSTKSFKTLELSTNKCKFCHIEEATKSVIKDINQKGYSIIEIENCN
ncbi:DUF2024 family protein [Seonamhaeicola marinus]|uniref:DUF2024 family protein n=1 Tax=Seonamhaeicola marinus TaxID=1912246 RepID=A0A5D0HFC0_9FLAO|nr:DUF2024 family protein [Seonamhaeicola marinus]TYA69996.1 DUF2024 family protein [Seonamhaeicola marinus]